MSITSSKFILRSALLALVITTLQANAFYDPNIGRWINRDPVGESDGPNLYAFVGNRALNFIDIDGRSGWGPPFFPPLPPEGGIACGNRIKNEVWAEYGISKPKWDPTDGSAREAHCIAHCRITRECPGGAATSWLGGFGKEILDEIKQWGGNGDGYDPGDMGANAKGRQCAKKNRSCEEQCKGVR